MNSLLNTGPELETLRKTKFYLEFRPTIRERGKKYPFFDSCLIHENDDSRIEPFDRFFFAIDFIFGDVLRNIRSRRWIKFHLRDLIEGEDVDEIGAHFLYRSYLNELVILMERLQRLIELIELGFGDKIFAENCDRHVLRFFNPVLAQKRNQNHHNLYLSYPRSWEVDQAAIKGRFKGDQTKARILLREVIEKELTWMNETEDAFAEFLANFIDNIYGHIRRESGYANPTYLPADFNLNTRLKRTLRRKYRHEEVFEEKKRTEW